MPRPSRRTLLRAAAAAPLAWSLRSSSEPPRPRNLLVLVADDLGRSSLPIYGNPDIATPAIDALAKQSVRFEKCYTPTAICLPSRSCMYTGLYPQKNGASGILPIRAEAATLPELLSRERCATALIGKLHVEPAERFPFEFLVPNTSDGFGDERAPGPYAKHLATFLASLGERRFCAFVNFVDPHRPFDGGDANATDDNLHAPAKLALPRSLIDTPQTREDLARYYFAIERLDAAVGKVLAALEKSGRANDTLVVFTSDNGPPFPFAKTTLYEAGIRMPFLVRWPGVVAPGVNTTFVSLLDLLPTALDAFGAERPAALDGFSLLPLLRAETRELRDAFVGTHEAHRNDATYPMRSLRVGNLKYILNLQPELEFQNFVGEVGYLIDSWKTAAQRDPKLAARFERMSKRPREELYDLQKDPYELDDLAAKPERAEDVAALRKRLHAWMQSMNDARLESWPFEK
jgi:N-sulfoglucosamine sulfohydrolase